MTTKRLLANTLVVRGWNTNTRHGVEKRISPNKYLTFCGREIEGTTMKFRYYHGAYLCSNCIRISNRAANGNLAVAAPD